MIAVMDHANDMNETNGVREDIRELRADMKLLTGKVWSGK